MLGRHPWLGAGAPGPLWAVSLACSVAFCVNSPAWWPGSVGCYGPRANYLKVSDFSSMHLSPSSCGSGVWASLPWVLRVPQGCHSGVAWAALAPGDPPGAEYWAEFTSLCWKPARPGFRLVASRKPTSASAQGQGEHGTRTGVEGVLSHYERRPVGMCIRGCGHL